jgi:hypothetical protein
VPSCATAPTTLGTVTDVDGKFSLEAKSDRIVLDVSLP